MQDFACTTLLSGGYGDANDPMFEELKKKEAVGEQFLLPDAWLPDAKSVISFLYSVYG